MLDAARTIALAKPRRYPAGSVENAIRHRRSVRGFRQDILTLGELGQLLWAAQGTTGPDGGRSVSSAGALYPLETFVAVASVANVDAGVYRYLVHRHAMAQIACGDTVKRLVEASGHQDWIESAPAVLCIAAVFARTTAKYGDRGRRYVLLEAGHAAQSMMLQAVALGLGTTMVGAFSDEAIARVFHLATDEVPLCLIPVGRP